MENTFLVIHGKWTILYFSWLYVLKFFKKEKQEFGDIADKEKEREYINFAGLSATTAITNDIKNMVLPLYPTPRWYTIFSCFVSDNVVFSFFFAAIVDFVNTSKCYLCCFWYNMSVL